MVALDSPYSEPMMKCRFQVQGTKNQKVTKILATFRKKAYSIYSFLGLGLIFFWSMGKL